MAANEGTIRSSYAIADLSVRDVNNEFTVNQADIGGLVAMNEWIIRDSYVLAITEANNVPVIRRGSLVAVQTAGTITNSYRDAEYSIISGIGTSQTSVALQSPIAAQSSSATQAYYLWESADWDFGGSGYRMAPDSLKLTIGCPQSGCNGYELIDDLDFADAANYRDAANRDSYYADADGWQPLAFWGVHFDGNEHTIANLKVRTADRGGLFASLGVGSRLSNVGLLDVDISSSNKSGALMGLAGRDSRIDHCHTSGRVRSRDLVNGLIVGGLVGQSLGLVSHSRSSVAVDRN